MKRLLVVPVLLLAFVMGGCAFDTAKCAASAEYRTLTEMWCTWARYPGNTSHDAEVLLNDVDDMLAKETDR